MQAATATSEGRSRGSPSAMEKGGDQSAKKASLELVVGNGPVKRQMVVHEAGEIVPAEQGPTMQISVKMDVAVLHCPFCFLPFKPPVFQCSSGHLACGDCRGERPGSQWQCEMCERGGAFDVRSTAMEAVVSSARVECPHDGCGRYITYHKLEDHRSACPHAACTCPVPGCDFAGPPPTLFHHLNTLHSVPVHTVQYGKVLPAAGAGVGAAALAVRGGGRPRIPRGRRHAWPGRAHRRVGGVHRDRGVPAAALHGQGVGQGATGGGQRQG